MWTANTFFSLDVAVMPERSLATFVGHYTLTMTYEYQQNIGIVIITSSNNQRDAA